MSSGMGGDLLRGQKKGKKPKGSKGGPSLKKLNRALEKRRSRGMGGRIVISESMDCQKRAKKRKEISPIQRQGQGFKGEDGDLYLKNIETRGGGENQGGGRGEKTSHEGYVKRSYQGGVKRLPGALFR